MIRSLSSDSLFKKEILKVSLKKIIYLENTPKVNKKFSTTQLTLEVDR